VDGRLLRDVLAAPACGARREAGRRMTNFDIGVVMFVGALVIIALRMPVGIAMLLVGGLGFVAISGATPLLAQLKSITYSKFSNYTLSVIPMFLLMGEFAGKGGLSAALYRAGRAWFGHWRGGLAIATIGGCAAFGAICGSSLATAATMSQVAAPEMRKLGYSSALYTGTLAAGGTLGILIPPSVILVIYAVYTEQSIGALFVAAIIPGLIATLQYMIVIAIYCRLYPDAAPRAPKLPLAERIRATRDVWPAALVFLLVVCGIYLGWFSPTEAAAVGAFAVGMLAIVLGGMRWKGIYESLLATAQTTAMIAIVLLGAELFSAALALSQMPTQLSQKVTALEASPTLVIVVILIVYLLLGCFMESMAMVLLTLPVFVPLLLGLDFGMSKDALMIWFGILVLISVEVGMISPPFGLNLFVINAMAKDVPIAETYKGVAGFCIMDAVRLVALVASPAIVLWLPGIK
jgi:tripartite ATP-independent transporter DctM subunit